MSDLPSRITCPTCGVHRRKPAPNTRTTTWSDDCACSDYGFCAAHSISGDGPDRPPKEVLVRRAEVENRLALKRYRKQVEKFREAEKKQRD